MTVDGRHLRTCPLCEAMCGIEIEVEQGQVKSIRGDRKDPFSGGFLCPKATALGDIHQDRDRIRTPLLRCGDNWEPISWDAAMKLASGRIGEIQRRHGRDSVAFYYGNPTTHSYGATLTTLELAEALGTKNVHSTASVDHLPHIFTSFQLYGHQALIPVPDIDRTKLFLVFGANPMVSNGSLMSAPGMARRIEALRARGGRLIVVDPALSKTAQLADLHVSIQPGLDVYLLLALVHTFFDERLVRLGRLESFVRGVDLLRDHVAPFAPERVAPILELDPALIRAIARDFAGATSAVCYGRMGVSVQRHAVACVGLIHALNILSGNLDRDGGFMLTNPAIDLPKVASMMGKRGSFDRYRSRVGGLPEFGGELPVSALADEIETPGEGQVRSLITFAGNPVLSAPNGARLERLLPGLEFMVAIDLYVNETTRYANLILPTTFALERDHCDILMAAMAVRDVTRYTEPIFEKPEGLRHDWEVMLELGAGIARSRGGASGWLSFLKCAFLLRLTPRHLIDLFLRFGPHRGLSVAELTSRAHTTDLGPLQAGRLPERLFTPNKEIRLGNEFLLQGIRRAQDELQTHGSADLVLIGRRQLRSNNSWMHNTRRLIKGKERCTLRMHPDDASPRGISEGEMVAVQTPTGRVVVPLVVTTQIRKGVVSLPHGFGHTRPGVHLGVSSERPGASLNDLTSDQLRDGICGVSQLNGIPVTVGACIPEMGGGQQGMTQIDVSTTE